MCPKHCPKSKAFHNLPRHGEGLQVRSRTLQDLPRSSKGLPKPFRDFRDSPRAPWTSQASRDLAKAPKGVQGYLPNASKGLLKTLHWCRQVSVGFQKPATGAQGPSSTVRENGISYSLDLEQRRLLTPRFACIGTGAGAPTSRGREHVRLSKHGDVPHGPGDAS